MRRETRNIPSDEDNLVSLFTTGRSRVLEFDDRIPGSIFLELSNEIGVVCILAGSSDVDLLVVCIGFIEDVVNGVGLLDLVKGLLDLRSESCESLCHVVVECQEERRKKRGRKWFDSEWSLPRHSTRGSHLMIADRHMT